MVDHAIFSAPFDVSTLEPDQLFNLALAAFLASGAVDECDVRFMVLAGACLCPPWCLVVPGMVLLVSCG